MDLRPLRSAAAAPASASAGATPADSGEGRVSRLRISDDFALPGPGSEKDILADVTAVVGRRGKGKTTTAVALVEEGHRHGRRFCVLDPVGAWWGLRSSRDGKRAGIPCLVMGGEHSQVPLEPTAGKLIAEFVADPSQPAVVLDLRLMTKGEQVRFGSDFLAHLYQRNREPLLLVLDEADQFAPQRPMPGEQVMLGAAERVVKLGRQRGLGVILITQRPATLNKNVLTQAGILVAHGLTGPQDQEAVRAWIRANADEGQAQAVMASLPGLPRGTAWWWAPDLDVLTRVDVRDRQTFDSSATPKHGARPLAPKVTAEVDLEKLTAEIRATAERAKENDPRALRTQIAELRAQLAKRSAPAAAREKRVEVPLLKGAQLARAEKLVRKLDTIIDPLIVATGELRCAFERMLMAETAEPPAPTARSLPAPAPVLSRLSRVAQARRAAGDQPSEVTPARQRILDALAWLEGVRITRANRVQLALLAGASPKSSAYANNLGALRSGSLIDYGGQGEVFLTPAGRVLARVDGGAPQTSEELQAALLQRLPRARARILHALIRAYPNVVSRPELAEQAEQSPTSSAYANNLGALRSLGLIDYRDGGVVAQPVLFLEGAA